MNSGKRILHIEDDPELRAYVTTLLQDKAEITRTDSIKIAKQLLTDEIFNLIILDMTLPDGSGMDIINQLNSNKTELPIIVFTGHDVIDGMPNVKRVFLKNRHNSEDLVKLVDSILG